MKRNVNISRAGFNVSVASENEKRERRGGGRLFCNYSVVVGGMQSREEGKERKEKQKLESSRNDVEYR